MSIENYNKTPFSKFVDYNDEDVHLLAENLFEKVRVGGILPNYIVRDKNTRVKTDINLSSGTFSKFIDNDFTFGNCISCSEILIESNIDIPVSYSVEFEVKATGAAFEVNLLRDMYIVGGALQFESIVYPFSSSFELNTFYKVKFVKNKTNIKILSNGVNILDVNVNSALPISTNSLLISSSAMEFSNLLILDSNESILGWWKMNFISTNNKYIDSGDGDYDFYSFWFSYCYILAYINIYRENLLLIENNDFMLKRFIESKGIAI